MSAVRLVLALVHLVSELLEWRRAAPSSPAPRAVPELPLGLPTCPAECPGPSLQFCLEPWADAALAAAAAARSWLGRWGLLLGYVPVAFVAF